MVCILPIPVCVPVLKASQMSYCLTGPVLAGCLVGAALVANLIAIGPAGAASMFTWRDANGVLQFSDTCPAGEDCIEKPIGSSAHAGSPVTSKRGVIVKEQGEGRVELSAVANVSPNDADEERDAGLGRTGDVTQPGDGAGSRFGASTVQGDGVGLMLSWGRLTDTTPAGYRIYYARAGSTLPAVGKGIDVGKATTFVLRTATTGARYKFKISAYDEAGNEVFFSNVIYKTMP